MEDARGMLIEENLGLVRHVAKRFEGRGIEAEELFQIGSIGLIKAIDRFDHSMGVRLSTYAVPMIIGEIKCYLRDNGPIKISRTIRENAMKLEWARRKYVEKNGREPSISELTKETGLGREEILLALEAGRTVSSLDRVREGEDGEEYSLFDRIAKDDGGAGECAVTNPGAGDAEKDRVLDRMLTEQALGLLDPEERHLIALRFFQEKTQSQVAEILGVSQVQVSRREKKILEKLRKFLNS